jgi:hypothetical protein
MAKTKNMKRSTKAVKPKRQQIGCLLDSALWRETKKLALDLDTTAGELLERFMREGLKRHGKK